MSSEGSSNLISIQIASDKSESGQKRQSGYVPGEKSGKWSDE